MAVTVERLIQILDRAPGVDEWVATETRVRRAVGEVGGRRSRGTGQSVILGAVVFRDSERGRGVGRLWLDGVGASEETLRALIAQAAERAALDLGPAWALPAPAAPARVVVADPDVVADPAGVVEQCLAQLRQVEGRLAAIGRARIDAASRSHRAHTSRGFASQYQATSIEFDVTVGPLAVAASARLERVRGRVRSGAQLFLHRRIADAARAAAGRAAARAIEPGRYDLLLRPAAITGPLAELAELDRGGRPAGFGWFSPLLAHGSGEWVRLGISRYRPGQPIFGLDGRAALSAGPARTGSIDPGGSGDPISVASDGTIPLAPFSAPFGDLGEPVRRFDLVRAGVAADRSLDYREAALARVPPNGGVRNIALGPGPTREAELAEPGRLRLLEVQELAWLDVDPRTGALTAGIRAGQIRSAAGIVPVTGGVLVDDVFGLLARARLSAEVRALGWYRGPAAIRVDGVDLVGP